MNIKSLIFVLGLATFLSCNINDHLSDLMSEEDLMALEGMQEGFDNALEYNGLLLHCSETGDCSSENIDHYDEQFHHFDALFDQHHSNYSHQNAGDDHHHENGMMNNHTGNLQRSYDMMGGETPEYIHDSETLQLMSDLRELHEEICPE